MSVSIAISRYRARRSHAAVCGAALLALTSVGAASAQNLPPSYGTQTFSTAEGGEVSIDLQAGGNINAQQVLGPACVGMVAQAPDFRVQIQGAGTVGLDASVQSTADTTLIISTPDGQWLCNDDSDGLNPAIGIGSARAGLYDIWVGTFDMAGWPSARLTVAAEASTGAGPTAGETAAVSAPPIAEWWYAHEGETVGPVPLSEIETAISDGDVTRDSLVWREGMDAWVAAESVDAVDNLFPVEPPPLPTTPTDEDAEPAMPPPLPPDLPESDDAAGGETAADDMSGPAETEADTETPADEMPPADDMAGEGEGEYDSGTGTDLETDEEDDGADEDAPEPPPAPAKPGVN